MSRVRLLMIATLVLAGCATAKSSSGTPPCPITTTTPVVAPGLAGRISYESLGGGGVPCDGIFVVNADGGGRRRLTAPQLLPFHARWSPDGRQVAFGGTCSSRQLADICVINADGTGLRAITSGPGNDAFPAWSPDGTRIAFARAVDHLGPEDIYIVNADGTGEIQVTSAPGDEWEPSWSPDGKSLVYLGAEGTQQLRLVKLPGGTPTVLAPGGTINQGPAFSHDGRRILFSSNRSEKPDSAYEAKNRASPGGAGLPPSTGADDIYVMDVDGRNLTRLTIEGANYAGAWSPDDRHIAFTSDRNGRQEIYVMGADGSGQVRLTNNPKDGASDPSWTS